MRIAVLASGNGSNFEALVQAVNSGELAAEIVLLFADQDALVLERAARLGIPHQHFSPQDFASKQSYEEKLRDLLLAYDVELVVLAGYMRIIGASLLETFPNRIVNIHPSLLPSFPGLHGIADAFNYGVKVTGITIHYIDAGVDTGPIIAQKAIAIAPEDTLETLTEKIHQLEHRWYPQVLADIAEKRSK